MLPPLGLATSLPNLHPLVLHFPIALAMFALALRVAHMVWPRWQSAASAAALSTVGAALGGAAAWWAGRQAVASLGPLSASAEVTLSRHANFAGWTVLALLAAAALATVSIWRQRSNTLDRQVVWRGGLFLSLVVVAGLLAVTADLGGRLVYVHGVAVAALSREVTGQPATSGVTLVSADGSSAVTIGPDGLVVDVSGPRLITLPGVYDDVNVSAVVNPAAFHGEIALVHHAVSLQDWEGMVLSSDGTVALVRVVAGQRKVLKKTSMLFPREGVKLVVTAAQGHFKGFVDDELLVHGHGPSGPPGKAALYCNGTGRLEVLDLIAAESAQQQDHAEHSEQ